MKINSFSARSVHGYMRFDFEFKANPTILTGPNGSGKTTALRMMQALLTPSIRDMLVIDFTEASIELSEGSKNIAIAAKKSRDKLTVYTSSELVPLEVPLSLLQDIELEYADSRRVAETSRLLRVKYSDNPTFKFISQLESPLFLGLDRRNSGFQDEYSPLPDMNDFTAREYVVHGRSGKAIRGSLGAGLAEMQALVRDAYRRVRRLKDAQAERLRRKLLLTGFKYEEVAHVGFGRFDHDTPSLSREDLTIQRYELIAALRAVGIDEGEARKEIDPFFDRVMKLADRVKHSKGRFDIHDSQAMLEALLNQASLRRLRELVETVREFNSKSEQLLNRFQSFVECINRFFADSHKKIEIDPLGAIKVHRPDGTEVPLEALSSGERQLLVMFGHVFFSSFGNRSNAFVIDEPELSLHLRWQEVLLQEMMDSSSRAQIIIATHSPEIVGELTTNCVGV